ncbi:MAG: hypothetical protein ACRDLB_13545 [Actinomycetota bacterium]
MMRQTTKRLFGAACVLCVAGAILAVFAGPAAAQVPEPGTLIEEVTDQVGDTTSDIGDGVADTVEGATETIGDVVGGDAGQAAEDVGEDVGGTVRDLTQEADDAVTGTGSTVGEKVDDVVGDLDPTEPGTNGGTPNVGDPTNGGRVDPAGNNTAGTPEREPSSARLSSIGGAPGSETVTFPASPDKHAATVGSSSDAGRDLVEAIGGITFPLALVALVAAFLAIQGRIDRADPKLSVATLDPEDEMLSFR